MPNSSFVDWQAEFNLRSSFTLFKRGRPSRDCRTLVLIQNRLLRNLPSTSCFWEDVVPRLLLKDNLGPLWYSKGQIQSPWSSDDLLSFAGMNDGLDPGDGLVLQTLQLFNDHTIQTTRQHLDSIGLRMSISVAHDQEVGWLIIHPQ